MTSRRRDSTLRLVLIVATTNAVFQWLSYLEDPTPTGFGVGVFATLCALCVWMIHGDSEKGGTND